MGRWLRWLVRLVWLWTALAAPRIGLAQASALPVQPAGSVTDALHSMTERAGVIFVGTVTAIRRREGDAHSAGVVEITFAVDQAVHGCTEATYTLREWGGLWMSGGPRYTVGEQRLMLLSAPGPGGLSSPLDGMNGAIPIHGAGQGVGPTSTSTDAAVVVAAAADLRWIEAVEVVQAPLTATVLGVTAKPLHGIARAQSSIVTPSTGSATTPAAPAGMTAPAPAASVQVAVLVRQIAAWQVNRAR